MIRSLLACGCAMAAVSTAQGQDLQLHYDWRHSVDPATNPRNFPSLVFKSFKVLGFGSFVLKLEGDFDGSRHNLSKVYFEVSQTAKFWKPPIFAHFEYTGGLGVFSGGAGGYTLDNAYLIGVAIRSPGKDRGGTFTSRTSAPTPARRVTIRRYRCIGENVWKPMDVRFDRRLVDEKSEPRWGEAIRIPRRE